MGLSRYHRFFQEQIEEALPFDVNWEQEGRKILKVILKTIQKGLERDGFVQIQGLGTFWVHKYEPRMIVNNFKTKLLDHEMGKERQIPVKFKVKFKPSRNLYLSLLERD